MIRASAEGRLVSTRSLLDEPRPALARRKVLGTVVSATTLEEAVNQEQHREEADGRSEGRKEAFLCLTFFCCPLIYECGRAVSLRERKGTLTLQWDQTDLHEQQHEGVTTTKVPAIV